MFEYLLTLGYLARVIVYLWWHVERALDGGGGTYGETILEDTGRFEISAVEINVPLIKRFGVW